MTRRLATVGALLVLAGCGRETSPPDASFSKPSPTVEAVHEGRAVEAWAARLSDPDAAARAEAVDALTALGPAGLEALAPSLARLLDDRARDVRLAAVVAAGRSRAAGPQITAALLRALAGPEPGIARAAKRALVALGGAAVPALRSRLAAKEEEGASAQAATVLGAIGADAAPAVPDLVAALSSEDVSLADAAGEALVSIGVPAVDGLAAALAAKESTVAALAAGALARIGPAATPAVPRLVAALSRVESVRSAAIEALVAIGPAARPGLDAASHAPDVRVSSAANEALSRIR